jgi:hypothetical protein
MEHWNEGIMGNKKDGEMKGCGVEVPGIVRFTHYSNIPVFQCPG